MSEHGERAGRLRVELFGTLRVRRDEAGLAVPGARLRGLLVRLALAGGRPVPAGTLVDALWPRDRPADPANALQSLVSRLRRVLGDADAVTQDEGGYRLAVTGDDVDVTRFERLAAAGRQRLRDGDTAAAAELLDQAGALVRGPVAAEVGAVAEAVAVRLGRAVAAALADAAETDLRRGRPEAAEARLSRLHEDHPLDERVVALLMDALAAQGRQAEALDLYERVREEVADRLGADPGAALRERHLRLLRGPDAAADRAQWPARGPDAAADREQWPARGPDAAADRDQRPVGGPESAAARDRAHRSAGSSRESGAWTSDALGGADQAVPEKDEAHPAASNLPEPLTSFIGREADLERVDALLSGGRLITVLGPGGAGKTRLATQAARRRRGDYRDGVWLIDLASVTAPAELPAAVLTATGLRAAAIFENSGIRFEGRGEIDVLVDQFAGRECLFVVDNCEHLIDAVAHLVTALLVRCPGLRILATSREPLAVDGEALVPLGPLGVPESTEPAEVLRSPAVRLFAERAAAVLPGFAVDERAGEATVAPVVQIVRRLDGLPLALELAAARLRTLGLAELAAGLDDRFRLLTTGSRTALPRHRTLRAVIAWSWDLLADDERALAERVSVLPGGVTIGSASAVCPDAPDIPDLLAALVDKSLLHRAPDGRYRMLETLREYGVDRLAEQGTLPAVRGLAARHLAALVAEHDPRLRTAEQLDALRVLRAEYDNALAALRHLCDQGEAEQALRLAMSLVWYWQMFGRHADAAFWLREALNVPGERDQLTLDCAEAVLVLNRVSAEYAMALESADQRRERMRELARRLVAHPHLPGLTGALAAVVLYMAEEPEAARARIDELVAGPDRWVTALALLFRAQVAENNGDVAQVRVDVTDALAGFRAAGDRWGQATVLPLRALLRQYDGDLDGALADLDTATSLAAEFGSLDLGDEVFIDLRRSDLYLRRGEPDEARAALRAARERAGRSASPAMMLLIDALEAGMLVALGDLDRAEELVTRAATGLPVESLEFINGDHGTAIIEGVRAALALRRGDPVQAEKALIRAYAAAQATRDMPILSLVAIGAASLADLLGRHRDAVQLLGAGARLRGAHDPTDLQVAELTRRNRAVLGEEAFAEAYAAGFGLDPGTALARIDPGQVNRALES
ncbi:putative ATPase/DNA-binding SARP family transcriptional activator [Actinoplanes octamycinicus]|uniref:Putative ATPase/DNA-binding SARP family transcriptional activator n=1 Tax=Actinoplanes octamycinicus TaxID=135948 RepID=A0A7W7H6Y0_9ACTN|nr:BTAD domain-containing putative transcriptional regulator [Actinoplanes octamycinicus]MBB4744989.1 putative ATPase/DNA-binding SARP family transcriptional activator [Actinoplanes octamycinicus]GIE55575.1 SARP family transcriptional regulator [Actinoplanes octamycinicus]